MSDILREQLAEHVEVVQSVRDLLPTVVEVADAICSRLGRGGTVWTFGNGGSAADAQHFAGELIGRFARERRPLPAVALCADPSVMTCIANDYGYPDVLARQVVALARPDDVVVAFSTSGESPSIVDGLRAARERGALAVLFTGRSGQGAARHADRVLRVPSEKTARIQEGHVLLLHLLSDLIDRWALEPR